MINVALLEKALNFDSRPLLTNVLLIEAFGEKVLNTKWYKKRGIDISEYLLLSNSIVTIREIRGKQKVTICNAS